MAWRRLSGVLVVTFGLALCGCATDPTLQNQGPGPRQPTLLDVSQPRTTSRALREDVDGPGGKPVQVAQISGARPPLPAAVNPPRTEGALRLSVRAWVND